MDQPLAMLEAPAHPICAPPSHCPLLPAQGSVNPDVPSRGDLGDTAELEGPEVTFVYSH